LERLKLDISGRLFRKGHNTVLLIALVLYLFVLAPILQGFPALSLILRVAFTLVLFSACYAIAVDRRLFRASVSLAVLLAALGWIGELAAQPFLLRVTNLVAVAFLLLVALLLLKPVLGDPPVTLDKLFGAISIYLLLGLAWAEIFQFIDLTNPGSFALSGPLQIEFDRAPFGGASSIYVYYSFVTLTTTGYGDMSPVGPVARSMASLEAIVGPLYLAILIARLVSLMSTTNAPRESQ
jgi:hypothetical protein